MNKLGEGSPKYASISNHKFKPHKIIEKYEEQKLVLATTKTLTVPKMDGKSLKNSDESNCSSDSNSGSMSSGIQNLNSYQQTNQKLIGQSIKEIAQNMRKAKSKSPSHLRDDFLFKENASPMLRIIKGRSNSNSMRKFTAPKLFPPSPTAKKVLDKDSIDEGSMLAQRISPTKANLATRLLKDTRTTPNGIKLDTILLKQRELAKFKRRRNEQLWNAAEAGKTKVVAALLNKGKVEAVTADVNSKGIDHWQALHFAASEGHLQIAQILIMNGADVNSLTSNERTPLHITCVRSHLELGMLFLTHSAKVNAKDFLGNTSTHYASEFGYLNMLKLLLSYKPDLSIKNKAQKSAIDVALNINVLKIFEEYIHTSRQAKNAENNLIDKNHSPPPVDNKSGSPRPTRIVKQPEMIIKERTGSKSPKDQSSKISGLSQPTNFSSTDEEEEKLNPDSFKPVELIGKGSFGEVYLVERKSNGKLYAMKILSKKKIVGNNLVKYAKTERNVMSITRHPFIVGLHYAFQTAQRLYIIMDYCPGGDLGHVLRRERRFTEDRARIYLAEIILALEDLHRRDIIFRDLKPDNVVLDTQGHVLLTDFGLSKQGILDNNSAKSFCGSVAYLAPEMLKRSGHGKSVDWYLLGVILYEMLVGIPPYFNKNRDILFQNIQKAPLKLPTFVSEKSKNLLLGLLHRNPHKRLGSGPKDAEEIKVQPFFESIDWTLCSERKLPVPKPHIKDMGKVLIRESVIGDVGDPLQVSKQNMISDWTFIIQDKSKLPFSKFKT